MFFTDASLSGHIAFPEVGELAENRKPTPPRPTLTHLLAPRTIIHEGGDRDRNALFSSLTYNSDGVT